MVSELMRLIIPQTTQHYWANYPSDCGFRTNEIHTPRPPGHSQEVLPPDSELAVMGKSAAMKPASMYMYIHVYLMKTKYPLNAGQSPWSSRCVLSFVLTEFSSCTSRESTTKS